MSLITDFFKVTPKRRKVKIKSKRGVIYSNPTMGKKALFYAGNLILITSFIYITYLYWPIATALVNYSAAQRTKPISVNEVLPTPTINPINPLEFSISIPKILAHAQIIPNVSPFNEAEYLKVLKNNVVALAKGSDMPGGGLGHTSYVFAHSTQQGLNMLRINAVFYLLGELKNGDEVFVSYQGKIYTYRIYQQLVVDATQIQYLQYKDPNKEVLIMQTCWPLGTDWKRLLVFGERV